MIREEEEVANHQPVPLAMPGDPDFHGPTVPTGVVLTHVPHDPTVPYVLPNPVPPTGGMLMIVPPAVPLTPEQRDEQRNPNLQQILPGHGVFRHGTRGRTLQFRRNLQPPHGTQWMIFFCETWAHTMTTAHEGATVVKLINISAQIATHMNTRRVSRAVAEDRILSNFISHSRLPYRRQSWGVICRYFHQKHANLKTQGQVLENQYFNNLFTVNNIAILNVWRVAALFGQYP